MHRLIALFACLAILFSVAGGSVTQAAAPPTCTESTATDLADTTHVDGDSDQVPADAEKGYPHHHEGCHGHDVGAPFATIVAFETPSHDASIRLRTAVRNATSPGYPALRPPRA